MRLAAAVRALIVWAADARDCVVYTTAYRLITVQRVVVGGATGCVVMAEAVAMASPIR